VTASDTARAGYKAYLKALGKSKAELLTMAAAVESGIEETIITSLSGDGTGTGAQVSALTKTDRLAVIMEVYAEGNAPRSLCAVVDRSLYASPV
jgi:phosphoribosylformimino-5-aminoimidazole carboxamide ribonucleotide (ProFAR) isomerase